MSRSTFSLKNEMLIEKRKQGSYSKKEIKFQYIRGWIEVHFQDISSTRNGAVLCRRKLSYTNEYIRSQATFYTYINTT